MCKILEFDANIKEARTIDKWMDKIIEKKAERILAQRIREANINTARNMLKLKQPIQTIMETTELSFEEICELNGFHIVK